MSAKESFIFYKSYFEAIETLPEKQQLQLFKAIACQSLYGQAEALSGAVAGMFKLIAPQIEANQRRYENGIKGGEYGKRGGRPASAPQSPGEPEPKTPMGLDAETPMGLAAKTPNGNENDTVNETVNGNENGNENGTVPAGKAPRVNAMPPRKQSYGEFVKLSEQEHASLCDSYGSNGAAWMIARLDNYKGASGKKYKSDYRAILSWVAGEYEKHRQQPAQRTRAAPFDPEDRFANLRALKELAREMDANDARGNL